MFTGSMTALVTPFSNGEVDVDALRRLVEYQIEGGTDVLVACGTTGETPMLTAQEYKLVVSSVIEQVGKRIPVVAGSGTSSTRSTIEMTRTAKELGVDGALVVCPYYIKPTQEGIYQHYKALFRELSIPTILYNIPGRTGKLIEVDTLLKLSLEPDVVGIKEASGNLGNMQSLMVDLADDVALLSGDDGMILPILAIGGRGTISVTSNIVPKMVKELHTCFFEGNVAAAQALNKKLFPLFTGLFVESNPSPTKAALSFMGLCSRDVRLPLMPLSTKYDGYIMDLLKDVGALV